MPHSPARPDLAALLAQLPARPLTRFAPAPTGYLHLGHVVNAVYVWGLAGAIGGRVLLRVEDHDRLRCRPAFEAALLDDLDWLGLVPDLGRSPGGTVESAYRQSDNGPVYAGALSRLAERTAVYACDCSRRDIREASGDIVGEETPYSGRCRARGLGSGPGVGLRAVLGSGEEAFTDALLGPQRQEPARQCGDLLVQDRVGQWTYQFSVVVDDLHHGVDLVVRGEDLLASAGRQLRLAHLLGREAPPVFLHHPLARKPSGAKLSKSDGDTAVRELRAAGCTASQLLGRAACLAGLTDTERPLPARHLAALFA